MEQSGNNRTYFLLFFMRLVKRMDREKVIKEFDDAKELVWLEDDEYTIGYNNGIEASKNITLALLKEQEAVVKQWTKEIADNQIAHAPKDSNEFMSLNEHLENEYKRGIWDGLQIAWNIISEGR